jgi:RHS repeat-associated protein
MCYAAADVNLDGRVDASDESAWLALLQMGGMNPVTGEPDRRMDLNGDGDVTQADFDLWDVAYRQARQQPTGNPAAPWMDDAPFNGVAEGGVLSVPTRSGTHSGGTWVMHGVDNRFGFAGYMWDPFLKLYHVRHRVYDPMAGRWLQRDPIGMAGGWNLYQYCGGEPWGYVDPMGLWSLQRWLWTGDGNASDEVYDSALAAGASTIPALVVKAADAVDTKPVRRVVGGVQAVGGATVALAGAGMSAIGIGVPVAFVGADMFQAGVRQVISGEWEATVVQKIFVSAATAAGVHPDDVPLVAGVATAVVQGGAIGVAAGLTPLNGSFKLQGRSGVSPAGGQSCGSEVNLASKSRTNHILHGDQTGGGHLWPGAPGKSTFPRDWSPARIMHEISDIATDPSLTPVQQTGTPGSLFTKSGRPARFAVVGERGGIRIKVILEPAGEGIVTGFPVP